MSKKWSEIKHKRTQRETNQTTTKEKEEMEKPAKVKVSNHTYHFVTQRGGVDYVRVLREAPENTPFILVELRKRNSTRTPESWVLYIHNSILNDKAVDGMILGSMHTNSNWGSRVAFNPAYRALTGKGKFPGYVKQEIEAIKRMINPKNIKTDVTYL